MIKNLLLSTLILLFSLRVSAQCTTTYDSVMYDLCPEDNFSFNNIIHVSGTLFVAYKGDTIYSPYGEFYDTLTNYLGCDSILEIQIYLMSYTSETYHVFDCFDGNYNSMYWDPTWSCFCRRVFVHYHSIAPKPYLSNTENQFWNDSLPILNQYIL
jgi:hypothetical protein